MRKFIILFLLLASLPSFAQMVPQWSNITAFSPYGDVINQDAVLDDSSNVYSLDIVTGYPFGNNSLTNYIDPVVHKVSKSGETMWNIRLGTIQYHEEEPNNMKIKGGFLYVYCTRCDPVDSVLKQTLFKINTNGEIQWIRKVNEAKVTFFANEPKIEIDSSGNIWASAFNQDMSALNIYKFNSEGIILDSICGIINGVQQFIENFIVLKNNKILAFSNGAYPFNHYYVSMFESDNSLIWIKELPISGTNTNLQFNDSSLYIAYDSYVSQSVHKLQVLKCDLQGNLKWNKEFPGPYDPTYVWDYIPQPHLFVSDDKNLVIANNLNLNNQGETIFICKLNSQTGDSIWTYRTNTVKEISCASQDKYFNIYLGVYNRNILSNEAYQIYKFSSSGNLLRITENNGYLNRKFFPMKILLNSTNDLFACGNDKWEGGNYIKSITIRFSQPVNITPNQNTLPDKFFLNQNYPNPFNPATIINFQIPKNNFVNLKVFDINGREISELVNENLNAGEYKINFNGSALPSGVYYYKLTSENFSETKKMILVK